MIIMSDAKIKLPDVTLVMIETLDHELGRMAVENCVEKADFAEVLIFTDRPSEFYDCRVIPVKNWPSKLDWCKANWFLVPKHVHTSHILFCQWDAGIWDASMWRDEFLAFDFIGSPWWHPTKNVGNSGFSLKSTRLARYIYDHRADYPCVSETEDDLLCRTYRPRLEEKGFVWAPENVAYDFAYEGCDGKPPSRHFGFHALFNMPHVFDRDDLFTRLEFAMESPYISKSYMMKTFCDKRPDIIRDFVDRNKLQAAE
jgi:Protein of unknown function (DUF5672)